MPISTRLGAVGELAASRHGAFTRRQAADIGISHTTISRLRDRGVLCEPTPGVLVIAGMPTTFEQRVYVATLVGGGGLAIGGTAARLHMYDGFAQHADVHVAIRRGGKLPLADVRTSQIRERYGPADVTMVHGIPCDTAARTLCDLARFHPSMYERATDDFQRRGHSLVWLHQTVERIPRMRGDRLDLVAADIARRALDLRIDLHALTSASRRLSARLST